MRSAVSDAASTQLQTIQFSLNETSRVHDVTTTLIDDVIANNDIIHRIISQVDCCVSRKSFGRVYEDENFW